MFAVLIVITRCRVPMQMITMQRYAKLLANGRAMIRDIAAGLSGVSGDDGDDDSSDPKGGSSSSGPSQCGFPIIALPLICAERV